MGKYVILKTISNDMGSLLFLYTYGRYISELTGKKIYLDLSGDKVYAKDLTKEWEPDLSKFNTNWMGGKILLNSDKRIGKLLNLKYRIIVKTACILSGEWDYRITLKSISKGYIGKFLQKLGIVLNFDLSIKEDYYKNISKGNMLVQGYFRTTYFAENIRDTLWKELTLKNISDQMIIAEELIERPKSVALYLLRDCGTGNSNDEDYYIRSIKRMVEILGNDSTFYIFSNDFDYTKALLEDLKYNIVFADWDLKEYEELILMSKCKHFILSKHTLSWWGQFLSQNKNKIVISQSNWFLDDPYKGSFFCNDWITMESRTIQG